MRYAFTIVLTLTLTAACFGPDDLPLELIELPDGFEISIYTDQVPKARSLRWVGDGLLFVSTRRGDKVYAVVDDDGDFKADRVHPIISGLDMPNGIAFRDGSLYIAENSRIIRLDDIRNRLENPPEPVIIRDDLPTETHHGWRYIDFGPDGRLYLSVGAPCNVCVRDQPFASIVSMKPDGSDQRVEARGVRNSVGFEWHPETGQFWFTDNGRDHLGDNRPPCELNRLPERGAHFGFPYVHGESIIDPEFGEGHDPDDYVGPAMPLGPHVAPLGMEFYRGEQFPDEYRNQIFIAEHGSWNRSEKIGYRVSLVRLDDEGNAASYETFAGGWLQGERDWGRPVDLEHLPDGSLLLSDDENGVVYRIAYTGT